VINVKEKVDLLIMGGYVLAMDDEGALIDDGGVAVADDKIVAVDKTSLLESEYEAEKTHGHLDMEVWRKPGPCFWHGVRWEG